MLNTVDMKGKARRPSTMHILKRTSGKGTYDRTILVLLSTGNLCVLTLQDSLPPCRRP